MKLRRIIAASAAAALAASTVAATASAITINGVADAGSGIFVFLLDEKKPEALYTDMSLASTITKVTLTISTKSFEDVEDLKGATWMGGGFGFNSESTGWEQHEWSFQDGVKELTWEADKKEETYTLTFDKGAPIFAATDTYAQVWVQSWDHEPFEFEIVDFELLNADGVDIRELKADAPVVDEPVVDEPVVDEPVVEETEEIVVEETEEIVVEETEEIVVEETEEIVVSDEPVVDEPVVDEPAVDEPAVDTEAPTTGDKQSPDTGVEGIAAVAGVVALAGAAVVASRKRK